MWKVISYLRKNRCTNFTNWMNVFSTSKTAVLMNPSYLDILTNRNAIPFRETNTAPRDMYQQNLVFNIQQRHFRTSMNLWEEIIVSAPIFPESIAEGDVKWLKAVGDKVTTDEVICEIETDKTAIAVPSPGNGVIVEIYAKEGDAVKYKQQLFKLKLEAGTGVPAKKPTPPGPEPSKPEQKPTAAVVPQVKPTAPISPTTTKQKETKPLVQKEIPTQVKQPYPIHSAVVKIPPQDPTKEISGTRSEYRVKMNRMRQKIAGRLKEAQNTAAMLTTFNEIDMSKIIAFRKSNQDLFTKKHGIKLGFMSAFIKASSYALQDQPVVNAVIDGNEIVYRDYVDISVAVATPKGLVVPVLRNVQNMNFADIENGILQLGEKARKGKLAIEDMDGGTFTISNGGVFGSLMGTPIINPPQSAILGMHATIERPVAIKQEVVIRPMMYVALTYDHRLIDGREAVLFLRKIKAAVEDPTIMFAGL